MENEKGNEVKTMPETKKMCPMCAIKTNSIQFDDGGKILGVFCINCVVRLLGAAVPDRRRFTAPDEATNENN